MSLAYALTHPSFSGLFVTMENFRVSARTKAIDSLEVPTLRPSSPHDLPTSCYDAQFRDVDLHNRALRQYPELRIQWILLQTFRSQQFFSRSEARLFWSICKSSCSQEVSQNSEAVQNGRNCSESVTYRVLLDANDGDLYGDFELRVRDVCLLVLWTVLESALL